MTVTRIARQFNPALCAEPQFSILHYQFSIFLVHTINESEMLRMSVSRSESYKAAGVDVTAGYEAVKLMKPMVESTFTKGVMGTLGGFGGLFRPDFNGMKDPILVSGTDGVGTKLKLAFLMDKHDTVGIDLSLIHI